MEDGNRKLQTFLFKNQNALYKYSWRWINSINLKTAFTMKKNSPAFLIHLINRRPFFVLLIFLQPFLSYSQINPSFFKKFSPLLQEQRTLVSPDKKELFVIAVSDSFSFRHLLGETLSILTVYHYPATKTFLISASWKDIYEKVLPRPEVIFIDMQRIPREELAVSNLDISVNKISTMHSRYPQYNGAGVNLSVKENRPDSLDIDFKGRFIQTNLSPSILSNHATIMSTIIAGAGNSYYEGKGVATGAGISSSSFSVLLPEPDISYQQYNITVQNHSYGTGIENYYGADAASYDASVITRPQLLHVFSAGNSGTQTSSIGNYAGVPGFANITGSFKMAKDIITVGHTDSFGVVLSPSSRGPAYDGRIKPELVAFGEDGSSGAAAIVSGIALALQQAYKTINSALPSAALVKAVLFNTADDAGAKGIDYHSGYGSVNALKAMQAIVNGNHFIGSISGGGTNVLMLTVPANLQQLKITLAWNDPPAAANAAKALRNDLDIELSLPATGEIWKPWVLSHFPHPDSLQQLPQRKRDSLNTAEQVTIDNPVAGNYTISVKGFNVAASGPQSYFISYRFDTLDQFTWHYPCKTDNIFAGSSNTIRWRSSFPTATGQLQYSINNGSSWQTISNSVDLAKGYYQWNAPDTFVTALLRMNFAVQDLRSDTFTISKRFNTYVGFNCPDSFLFYWNRVGGVNSYQVYRLGEKYMEPLLVTTDTLVVLGKQANPSLYYAVAPLINTKTGVRSYGFDYTTQGTGCYIKTFTVSLVGNSGVLDLELGTTYRVRTIGWEKLSANGFAILQTINNPSGLVYSFNDNSLSYGVNTYRVKIELLSGQVIYSQPESLNYFGEKPFIVYPNPAKQYEPVTIIFKDPQPISLQLFNSAGIKMYEKQVNDIMTTIPAGKLSKGLYFIRVIVENKEQTILKLVVY